MKSRLLFICGLLLLSLCGTAYPLATKRPMPEFLEVNTWIGSPPLSRKQLEGKVVLVHFWDYACLPCLEDLAILNQWSDKYDPDELQIIGIHTPDFEFEKNLDYLTLAVRKLRIRYPVAVDSSKALWGAYNNLGRPAVYFIDSRSRIRAVWHGAGRYDEREKLLQDLIREIHLNLEEKIENPKVVTRADENPPPQFYFGARRLSGFGNTEPKIRTQTAQTFARPDLVYPEFFYLEGMWRLDEEKLALLRAPGSLLLRIRAAKVGLVAQRSSNSKIPLEVRLDGQPLTKSNQGRDIAKGKSAFRAGMPRLYQIVDGQGKIVEGLLEIKFPESDTAIYALAEA